MGNTATTGVSKPTLLLIGFSGGLIAAYFPRLMPVLSPTSDAVSFQLFTPQYLWVATAFALMIGIAMIWLYNGTREHTKNLFLSALALPAVLSGGINVASVSSKAGQTIDDLNNQTNQLIEELEKQSGFETLELDIAESESIQLSFLPQLLGISTAHAADVTTARASAGDSVRITASNLERNYVLAYAVADNKAALDAAYDALKNKRIDNLRPVQIGQRYYLLGGEPRTKTQALMDALEVQNREGIKARLVKLK